MLVVYKILYFLIFFLSSPYWLIKAIISRKYFKVFTTRFFANKNLVAKKTEKTRVLLWALSLGEVLSARELVLNLEEKGLELIIASTTLSGLKAAKENWPGRTVISSPFDFTFSVQRFLKVVQPDIFILVETDIWPNMLINLKKNNIPTLLLSARVGDRSFKGYKKIQPFWSEILNCFNLITSQTEEDKQRLLFLGAKEENIKVVGNLKFDREINKTGDVYKNELLEITAWPKTGRWLVAGSLHSGEEILVLNVYKRLLEKYNNLKLLLAPRNKADFINFIKPIKDRKLKFARRTKAKKDDIEANVFLLDSLGELENFYELAEIALIGKSWPGKHEGGGHNPLEPAARGKAVLFGSEMHNFRWMTKALIEAKAAEMVKDEEALFEKLDDLLAQPLISKKMGENGKKFVLINQGALARTTYLITAYLKNINNKN